MRRLHASMEAMQFTLAADLFERIVEYAKAAYPKEACALIAAQNGVGLRLIPMKNVAESSTRFEMDPTELVRALRSLREAGEDLGAIFHSHPSGPATPSSRDIHEAGYPEAVQIIVSLENPDSPRIRAFQIRGTEVSDVELHIPV